MKNYHINPEDFSKYGLAGDTKNNLKRLCASFNDSKNIWIIFGPQGSRKTCLVTEIAIILKKKKCISNYKFLNKTKEMTTSHIQDLCKKKILPIVDNPELDSEKMVKKIKSNKKIKIILVIDKSNDSFPRLPSYNTGLSKTNNLNVLKSWLKHTPCNNKAKLAYFANKTIKDIPGITLRNWEDYILNLKRHSPQDLFFLFFYPSLLNSKKNLSKFFNLFKKLVSKKDYTEILLTYYQNIKKTNILVRRPIVIEKSIGTNNRSNILFCEIYLKSTKKIKLGKLKIKEGINKIITRDGKKKCTICKQLSLAYKSETIKGNNQFCDITGQQIENKLCNLLARTMPFYQQK